MMQPDLEVVQIGRGETFRAYEHGYPFSTVRWHFHPEYELHHVVARTGRYFVGDFIGTFEPGNLVLTGPNLPHNWVSDVEADEIVPLRNRGIQFKDEAIRGAMGILPELQCLSEILDKSRSGLLFSKATSEVVEPYLAELVHARGIRRIELFIGIVGALSQDCQTHQLTGAEYLPDPSGYMSSGMNRALAFIDANLTEPFNEGDLAEIAGKGMDHVRGAPHHPQTQGKIERWHQTMKNRVLLENYFLPGDLERQIGAFVDHYNHHRYHESLNNLTPTDVYHGRGTKILKMREEIKKQTIQKRRLQHQSAAA